ncbi:MAG TPA: YceI family protein [Gammaproteobacteria bacterium]
MRRNRLLNVVILVALAILSRPILAADVPAGVYTLDLAHASLIFRVDHIGFSNYTARFTRFDATLEFDPENLAASSVVATVDARSIETHYPETDKHDFNAQLQNEQWLDTAKFPEMTFRSTKVEVTGPNAMRIHGEFELHGVAQPVILDATYNGGYAGHPLEPRARIGFSARGALKRSDFGIAYGIPTAEMPMGVGDVVEIIIEAEFTGPPLADAAMRSPDYGARSAP